MIALDRYEAAALTARFANMALAEIGAPQTIEARGGTIWFTPDDLDQYRASLLASLKVDPDRSKRVRCQAHIHITDLYACAFVELGDAVRGAVCEWAS